MLSKRISGGIKMALALPLYQMWNLVAYAGTREGWPAKLATVSIFLPILALTTVCWAMLWAIVLWSAWHLVS
jgi:hypothetical protein